MERKKIERINELARKKKTEGLTEEETAEQAALRHEYLAEFRENLKTMFWAGCCDEAGTKAQIGKIWKEYGYLMAYF